MIYKGTKFVEKASLYGWDRSRGPSVTRVFDGDIQELINLYPVLTASGEAESLSMQDKGDGTAILTAIYYDDWARTGVGATGFVNQFELLGNDLMKDIFLHRKTRAIDAADKAANGTQKIVDAIRKESVSSETKELRLEAVQRTYGGISPALKALADQLFEQSSQRQDTFATAQFVFRQTKTVGSRYTGTVDMQNIDCVYSTTEMQAEISATSSAIPDIYIARLNSIPAPEPTYDPAWYFWGWLKKTPTTSPNTLNREAIVQEWWLAIWSLYDYDRKT